MALFLVTSNPRWQAAILDNFEWPYLRSGSFDLLSAHRAAIITTAQLSCLGYDDCDQSNKIINQLTNQPTNELTVNRSIDWSVGRSVGQC